MRKSDSIQALHGSLSFSSDIYFKRGQLSKILDFGQFIEPKFLNQLSKNEKVRR